MLGRHEAGYGTDQHCCPLNLVGARRESRGSGRAGAWHGCRRASAPDGQTHADPSTHPSGSARRRQTRPMLARRLPTKSRSSIPVVSSNLCRWNHLHPCPCNGSITSFRSLAFSLLLMSAHGWNSIIGGKSGPTRWQWYDTNTNTNTPRLATVRTNQLVPDVERPFASMHARTLSLLLTSKGQR